MQILALTLVFFVAVMTACTTGDIAQEQTTVLENKLNGLPETSAIKQALAKKMKAEQEAKRQRQAYETKRKVEREREEFTRDLEKRLSLKYVAYNFDYFPHLRFEEYLPSSFLNNKDGRPREWYPPASEKTYPHCRKEIIKNYVGFELECAYVSFLVDRVLKNNALQEALFLTHAAGLEIVLSLGKFYIFDRGVVVNINADDETIVRILTENAEINGANKN